MKLLILAFILIATNLINLLCLADAFPTQPNLQVTPGTLCQNPDAIRYPEKINYCNRNVKSDLKKEIIKTYDSLFGYTIESMDRNEFKIDHFIPLCMGGGNDKENLWPQHVSVYTITDPLEPTLCGKMEQGLLRQADAVEMIKRGKLNLDQVPSLLEQINAL